MQNFAVGPSPAKPPKLTKTGAEAIAIEALGFLAEDPSRLHRFLALSGISLENLRVAAAESGFLAAILDHLASSEPLLLAFAANTGHAPPTIAKARDILSPTLETP